MPERSLRTDVRNPVLALPSARGLRELPPAAQETLSLVLAELGAEARARADRCWRKHKAPMAAYWKAVAVYAKHLSRAMRPSSSKGAR